MLKLVSRRRILLRFLVYNMLRTIRKKASEMAASRTETIPLKAYALGRCPVAQDAFARANIYITIKIRNAKLK